MTRALVVAVVLGASAIASAQAPPAQAPTAPDLSDAVYGEGQELYRAKDYLGAAAKFEAAYKLTPDPAVLFNIAQAYRLGRACAQAARYYHRFLAEVPAPENLDKLTQYITEMDACAQREADASPHEVVHDTRVVHDVRVVDRGHDRRPLAIALGAAGLIGVGLGVYYTHDVHNIASERAAICSGGCVWANVESAASQLDSRGHRAEIGEAIAYGIGGVAIATSLALFLLNRDPSSEHAVAAMPVHDGAVVMTSWRF